MTMKREKSQVQIYELAILAEHDIFLTTMLISMQPIQIFIKSGYMFLQYDYIRATKDL